MKIGMLIVVLLFIPCLLSGQIPLTWQDIAGPAGYQIIQQGAGDTLYSTNTRGVVYWSTDGGTQWSEILAFPSSTSITNMSVNRNHVVVAFTYPPSSLPYFIMTWNNTPNSWTRIFLNAYDFSNVVVDNAGIVFTIGYQSLVRYDSQGWRDVNDNLPFPTQSFLSHIKNAVLLDDRDNFIVGVDSVNSFGTPGVYISIDTGKSWYQSLTNYAVTAVYGSLQQGIIAAASPNPNVSITGGVFTSSDSGKTWTGLGLENHQIGSILKDNNGNIFSLADGNVYKFIESSNSWEMKTNSTQPYRSLVAYPPSTILASSEAAGTIRSINEGDRWGGGEIRGKDVFAITETDSGDIVCGTLGGGIYRSVFGGTSWVASDGPCEYIYSFTKLNGSIYAGSDCGVLKSSDDGLSWNKCSDTAFPGSAFSLMSLNDGTLMAGTNYGIFRSSDNGVHWVSSGLTPSTVYFMDSYSGDNLVVGTASDGIFLSTDGGFHWRNLGLIRDDIQSVVVTPTQKIMVGVYGGIYLSQDTGRSWQYKYFDKSYCYTMTNVDTGLIYAGTYHGVFASSDDGNSWWSTSDSGLTQQFVLSLYHSTRGFSYAGTYRGGIYRSVQEISTALPLFVSSDRGMPGKFSLNQNYPNPFNPATEITYSLPRREFVRLEIYNLLGERIETLVSRQQSAGSYQIRWNASEAPSGVYICYLRAGNFRGAKKMLLLR